MTPIETRYKGYRFRSRLEARWAVFFDVLGVRWEYEPEGYDLTDIASRIVKRWRHEESTRKFVSMERGCFLDEYYEYPVFDYGTTDTILHEDLTYSDEEIDYLELILISNKKLWYLPDFYLPDLKIKIDIKPLNPTMLDANPGFVEEWEMMKLSGTYVVHGQPSIIGEKMYGIVNWFDAFHYFGHCSTCNTFGIGYGAWRERICTNGCPGRHKEDMSCTKKILEAISVSRSCRF